MLGLVVKQQLHFDHFTHENHNGFISGVSRMFMEKTNTSDPLRKERYSRHLKNVLKIGYKISYMDVVFVWKKVTVGMHFISTTNQDMISFYFIHRLITIIVILMVYLNCYSFISHVSFTICSCDYCDFYLFLLLLLLVLLIFCFLIY